MSEVQISTPRGIMLAGDFVDPVDSHGATVLFAHGFLTDRHSVGWFDRFAKSYRSAGYATLQIDLSGCGNSEDDVITLAHAAEDLRAASSWLTDQGFPVQVIHGHGWGASAAIKADAPDVRAIFASSPILGSRDNDWSRVFSEKQLTQLEQVGHTVIPNDACDPAIQPCRDHYLISKQTLADLTLTDPEELCEGLEVPVLIVHDVTDYDGGLAADSTEALKYMPEGSQVRTFSESNFIKGPEAQTGGFSDEVELALAWLQRHTADAAAGA
ncbi:MAG: alpha/beta hydrolase [Varibaculum sp.]|nr:alpha/beta hydrolase [Varibaculum sp.]